MNDLMNERAAAAYLGVSVSWMRATRSPGNREKVPEGPPYLKIGRSVRYDRADLDTFRERHRVIPSR